MATTKTLTPTNQTITIDAFQGEKPDHRHVADAETKLADAVNALNSKLAKFYRDPSNAASFTIDLGQINTSRYRLAILFQHESGHPSMNFISLGSGASPTVTVQKVFGDANSSSPSSVTMSNSTMTINFANTAYGGISLIWLD